MICGKCGLYNLDHVSRCVRCDAPLERTAFAEDAFSPPRAGKGKPFRNFWYFFRRRLGFRLNDGAVFDPVSSVVQAPEKILEGVAAIGRGRFANGNFPPRSPFRLVAELLIPSLYQFRTGQKILSWLFLLMFLSGFVLLLCLLGTRSWPWAISLIVIAQLSSLSNIFPLQGFSFYTRLTVSFFVSLILFFALSGFYRSLLMRYFEYRNWMIIVHSGFEEFGLPAGTVVHVIPLPEYKRGDVVLFAPSVSGRREYRSTRLIVSWNVERGGVELPFGTMERILGVPGDLVEVRDRKIYLNGSPAPSPVRPLGRTAEIPNAKFHLGNRYFIWCSIQVRNWRIEFSQVPYSVIYGKVERIIFPFWRSGELYL